MGMPQYPSILMMTTEALYQDFSSRLRSFIRARVPDTAAADDLLQEVFLRIHQKKDTLRQEPRLVSWLYQITRNVIVDYYRQQKPQAPLPDVAADPAPEHTTHDFARCLGRMVTQLPPAYAEALQQTELGSLSQKAYAAALGISYSGAKSRVQRAKEKLKDMFISCCALETDAYGNVIAAKASCDC
jgi:RNA polymerase sigma-70 factor (ECF subfamily)